MKNESKLGLDKNSKGDSGVLGIFFVMLLATLVKYLLISLAIFTGYPNWRRLDELRFELSEPPRSIEVAVRSTAYYVLSRDDPIGYFNPLLTAINQIHYMNTP